MVGRSPLNDICTGLGATDLTTNTGTMQLEHADRRSSSSQRLPVNPRRHKVAPEQRKRVATACNNCNVRRVKCSGGNPCAHCAASSRDCIYPVPVEKIHISRAELETLRRKADMYERALQETIPDPVRRQEILNHVASSSTPDGSSPSTSPFSNNQPFASDVNAHSTMNAIKVDAEADQAAGRLLQDPQGTVRFLGETSGALFLDHLKEVLGAVLPLANIEPPSAPHADGSGFVQSLGRYYTDDSLPLVEPYANPLLLPGPDTIGAMLTNVRNWIQDGHGAWPSGGVYWWGDLSSLPPSVPTPSGGQDDLREYRHLAFYHAALAVASQAEKPIPAGPSINPTPSITESSIARASVLLGNPLDTSRCCTIGDVATLALMAFCLIEMKRRDAAYMHVVAAIHICIVLGVHRGLVDERGKRVFWTVYILDRWLGCLMGRPPIMMDDAIRIALPADAQSMPPAAGLKAHVELSRISGYIVCNTYRVAPWETAKGVAFKQPDKAIWMLQQWQSSLPPRLQLSPDGLSNDPPACLLHMRYNGLLVLAIRPLFFLAVKKSVAKRLMIQPADPNPQSDQLKLCISAARLNMRLGRHIINMSPNQNRKPVHAELHFIINAAICLILESLVFDEKISLEEIEARNRDIEFAMEVEDGIESSGIAENQLPSTLRDLQSLVRRLTTPINFDFNTAPPAVDTHMLQPTMPHDTTMPLMPISQDHALYEELVAWVDDEWPMYNPMYSAFMQ